MARGDYWPLASSIHSNCKIIQMLYEYNTEYTKKRQSPAIVKILIAQGKPS